MDNEGPAFSDGADGDVEAQAVGGDHMQLHGGVAYGADGQLLDHDGDFDDEAEQVPDWKRELLETMGAPRKLVWNFRKLQKVKSAANQK